MFGKTVATVPLLAIVILSLISGALIFLLSIDSKDVSIRMFFWILPGLFLISFIIILLILFLYKGIKSENVTLRKELADCHEKLNLMINNVTEAVFLMDWNGKILFLNPAWTDITGFTMEESIGREVGDFIYPEDFQINETFIKSVRNETDYIEISVRLKTKNLSFRWVDIAAKKMITRKEVPVIAGRLVDITIKKLVEEELKTKKDQLLEMNRSLERLVKEEVSKNREKDLMLIKQSRQAAMGEMIGNIAHQWRQPLNALGLMLQNIQDAYQYNEITPEYMESRAKKVKELIKHMSQTIEDFRNFYRPDKEKQKFRLEEVIDKTITFVEASFKNNNIELMFTVKNDIYIFGFPNEYSQVLINILNNAKDVLLAKKIKNPRVDIELTGDQSLSSVTITDNGGGIPDQIIDKVFEPYFTTKEPNQGTGIGLYMSKTIIEKNMGGRLSVVNLAGGAQFTIEV
ncbi:MAG: PAS domain S-box protein [Firmicutes bacterium]|nr:PAS domain S-box protein [Bacillota bacterium]